MDHIFIKIVDTRTKKMTIINTKATGHDIMSRLKIDTINLLILQALSGCDTTSFVKGITKKKFFSTFFNDPTRYSKLISFASTPLSKEAVTTADKMLFISFRCQFSRRTSSQQ